VRSENTAIRLAAAALVVSSLASFTAAATAYFVDEDDRDCPQAVAR
jgi:hypothetical protein